MGERIRAFDWASHPLGAPAQWPPALQLALSLCLSATFPTAIYWGREMYVLYNDAWSVIPAEKHPWILGKPAREGWADIWDIVGPQFQQVLDTGEGLALYEQMLPMVRAGQPRETWWNYSFTAIRNADNSVGGVFNQGNEITQSVLARRERQAELQRWRELFRQAPSPVALLRGPEHRFEFANDAYLRLVGGRDIVGHPVAEALPEVVAQGFVQILDTVFATGEPYVGTGVQAELRRSADGPPEQVTVDFTYQPVRDAEGAIEGILVLATDVTERARAEAALRISNWQLGEERARLAAAVAAEQRAQQALRRFTETLEANVRMRTAELTAALEKQNAITDRLRATFETELMFQGFLDPAGTLLDANEAALSAIGCTLQQVTGRPFWDTPWFTATPGVPEAVRAAVEAAARGEVQRRVLTVVLPGGTRTFRFSLRPMVNARGELVGMVPEGVEIPAAAAAA